MDVTQYILLATVIAGITEMLNRLRAKDFWVAATIFTAAATGALFGVFGVEGLTVITGIAAGFGTSGSLSALGIVGNRSKPSVSTVLSK